MEQTEGGTSFATCSLRRPSDLVLRAADGDTSWGVRETSAAFKLGATSRGRRNHMENDLLLMPYHPQFHLFHRLGAFP